jgi:hypothetical protein
MEEDNINIIISSIRTNNIIIINKKTRLKEFNRNGRIKYLQINGVDQCRNNWTNEICRMKSWGTLLEQRNFNRRTDRGAHYCTAMYVAKIKLNNSGLHHKLKVNNRHRKSKRSKTCWKEQWKRIYEPYKAGHIYTRGLDVSSSGFWRPGTIQINSLRAFKNFYVMSSIDNLF